MYLRRTPDLEDRIPAKRRLSSLPDNLSICPSLEKNRLLAGTLTVSKGAHGLGTLVVVGREHLYKTIVPEVFKEVFAV